MRRRSRRECWLTTRRAREGAAGSRVWPSAVGDAEVHVHRLALIGGLVTVPPTRLYQAFRTSVLVARGRRWSAFDGPATAQTAQRRPRIEPKTSSVSTRSRWIRDVGRLLYGLLAAAVSVALDRPWWRRIARSSPRFLQSEGFAYLSGHPVAQATPGRAAPAWARWSTPRLNDLAQAGAVWLPPGVRWIPAGPRHPRAAGSRAGSPAAGGIFRVQGRRSCPPEAVSRKVASLQPRTPAIAVGSNAYLMRTIRALAGSRWAAALLAAVLLTGFVMLILVAPWLSRSLLSRSDDWDELSNVGQAYGGVSAILAGLAFCGIACSLLLQWRQVRQSQLMTLRERHFDLVKMGLEDSELLVIPFKGGRPEDMRKWTAYNLWVSYWAMLWDTRAADRPTLRGLLYNLFTDPSAAAWWSATRMNGWHLGARGRRIKFLAIADEAHRMALGEQPPGPSSNDADVQRSDTFARSASATLVPQPDSESENLSAPRQDP